MRLTLFPYFFAELVRLLHLPLTWLLLYVHLLLLWLMLYAVRRLAVLCFSTPKAQWMAVALTAFCLSTPVAGTALTIADPYLTPRSFAAPLGILLLVAVLDRRPYLAACVLFAALLFHPLMAVYVAFFALALWTFTTRRPKGTLWLCLAALLTALFATLSQRHITESPVYIHAALTRTYFYLADWQWYELLGLAAPLAIFFAIYRADRRSAADPHAANRAALTGAACACGITAIAISVIFVHPASHSHLLARMQPLRIFHTLYILLFLLLGGTLADWLLQRIKRPAFALVPILCLAAAGMFFVERQTFPADAHLEMPWHTPRNPWLQAFLWTRDNTPQNALFALDANYITTSGEDAQVFRAASQRSSLSDYSKDGGSSAIFPQLAPAWQQGQQLSTGLSSISDAERIARLAPAGVTWIIVQRSAQTHLLCPYRNSAVLVCELPQP